MRCKRHPYEGGVGVCASCLRERLLALVAAQEREASQSPEERRRSDAQQPPPLLVFPRSVSPYVSRRSGRGEAWHEDHHHHDRHHDHHHDRHHDHHHDHHRTRFYGTPQVGPPCRGADNKKGRFSLISSIFRSRSDDREADPRLSDASSKASSPSWISNLLPGRRNKKSRLFSLDEESSGTGGGCRRRSPTTRNRGMSPVSKGRDEGSESPPGSGYSSESPIGYRKHTPPGPPRRRAAPPHVSGFAFCLSPLLRATPNTSRVDAGFSGEIRSANRFHLSTAASLGANRSRKLADFGRYP